MSTITIGETARPSDPIARRDDVAAEIHIRRVYDPVAECGAGGGELTVGAEGSTFAACLVRFEARRAAFHHQLARHRAARGGYFGAKKRRK
jgi:hypothetical protein